MPSILVIFIQAFKQSFWRTLGVASHNGHDTRTGISKHATFAHLDNELYPLTLSSGQNFVNAESVLMALLHGYLSISASEFAQQLTNQSAYQNWINFTVYGRYIEHSFQAFYQQDIDDFNSDMASLLLQELKRHGRQLPKGQVLFGSGFSQGQLSNAVRHDKLLNVTVNPAFVFEQLQVSAHLPKIINIFHIHGHDVLAFAIKPKRFQKYRNELLILDFQRLWLYKEQRITHQADNVLLRYYQLS